MKENLALEMENTVAARTNSRDKTEKEATYVTATAAYDPILDGLGEWNGAFSYIETFISKCYYTIKVKEILKSMDLIMFFNIIKLYFTLFK